MKVFVDTAPFIYLAENHPNYAEKTKKYIAAAFANQDTLFTSVISLMEFSIKPEKEGNPASIIKLKRLWKRLNFEILIIDEEIAEKAAKLRAKYTFLKGLDALQIASALQHGCNQFLTNDIPLKKIIEIQVVLIADLQDAFNE